MRGECYFECYLDGASHCRARETRENRRNKFLGFASSTQATDCRILSESQN